MGSSRPGIGNMNMTGALRTASPRGRSSGECGAWVSAGGGDGPSPLPELLAGIPVDVYLWTDTFHPGALVEGVAGATESRCIF